MIPRLPEALLLTLLLTTTLAGPAHAARVIGEARDLRSGDLLYKELHSCEPGGILCSVAYVDDSGAVIAEKTIDYSRDDIAPQLLISDYRNQRELVINAAAEAGLVVDAGFDNFIRNNWQTLGDSGTVNFNFLVPGRDKALRMRARQAQSDECETGTLCLEVGLDNWLLGALTDPILLTYSRDSRRLLRYRGISNLASNDGQSQMVDIRYIYSATAE
jgi:hypothetical protein